MPEKIHASKEYAKRMKKRITLTVGSLLKGDRDDLLAFLDAAISRLPSQAAIDRDKKRKKTRKKPAGALTNDSGGSYARVDT
jgi:hypothetical protein